MSFDFYKNTLAQEHVAIQFSERLKLVLPTLRWVKQTPETSPLRGMYQQWEWELGQALLDHWDGQSASLIDELVASTLAGTASKGERLLDNGKWWDGWTGAYATLLIPFIESAGRVGSDAATEAMLADYGLGLDTSAVNLAAAEWSRLHSLTLAKRLTDTDREALKQSLASWIEASEDFPALVKRMEQILGDRERAKLISSTESTDAYAAGNRVAWKESGIVTGEIWNTAQDELVCKFICRPLGGQVSKLGEGDWHHVGGGEDFGFHRGPSGHPGCRCWTSPWTGPLPWEGET